MVLRGVRHGNATHVLKDEPATAPPAGWPRLAVLFTGRNEEAMVEHATRSMLGQDYPDYEVVAVDDRSTDATGSILDRLASELPNLRVVHVQALPEGWLGKTNALQTAADASSAEWLLFTDADIVFEPSVLRRAVALVTRLNLDHLTLAPDTVTETFGERVFMALFCLLFALVNPPWRIADRRRKAAMGVGAFNLVRAEAFRAVGGFRRIKLSVDDDMRFGQAMKWCGYRNAVATGKGCVSVRWHHGVWNMIRGLEKNYFAALDFRLGLAAVGVCVLIVIGVMPFVGLVVGPWWARMVCAVGIAAAATLLNGSWVPSLVRWYHVLGLPIGTAAMLLALGRSMWVTLRQGGVRWRDSFYPLDQLRSHTTIRNAWLREVWLETR
jgi:hypothetical protein